MSCKTRHGFVFEFRFHWYHGNGHLIFLDRAYENMTLRHLQYLVSLFVGRNGRFVLNFICRARNAFDDSRLRYLNFLFGISINRTTNQRLFLLPAKTSAKVKSRLLCRFGKSKRCVDCWRHVELQVLCAQFRCRTAHTRQSRRQGKLCILPVFPSRLFNDAKVNYLQKRQCLFFTVRT